MLMPLYLSEKNLNIIWEQTVHPNLKKNVAWIRPEEYIPPVYGAGKGDRDDVERATKKQAD